MVPDSLTLDTLRTFIPATDDTRVSTRMLRGEDLLFEILGAVAEAEGVDRTDLPPLGEVLDVDALLAVVDSDREVAVTFDYAGHRVHVGADDSVTVS